MRIKKAQISFLIIAIGAILSGCKGTASVQKQDTASSRESEMFQRKFFDAQSQKAIGNNKKAYTLFSEALGLSPENDAVMYEIARLAFEFEQYGEAEEMVNKALDKQPDNQWYHLFLADVYIETDRIPEAQKEYEKIVKLVPDNMEAQYELANLKLFQGDVQGAIDQYDKLESLVGVNEAISMEKQRLYLEIGKEEKAVAELKKLIDTFPNEVNYKGMLAQYYLDKGDEQTAMGIYEEIAELDPNNGMLHMKLSEYYAMKGDDQKSFEEVVLAFESTDVAIDHKVGILLNFYSATERDPSQLPRAYQLLDICLDIHGDEAKTYALYGDFLFREGRLQEARDMYFQAVQLDKTRHLIWATLLQLETEMRHFEDLRDEAATAVSLFPTLPEYYYYLGLAEIQLKNFEGAVNQLNMGKELVIENPALKAQFYSSLGDAYHAMEEHKKSDESYEEALKLEPSNVFVMNNYAYYLSLRGKNLERAAELAAEANRLDPGNVSFEDTYGWVLYKMGKYEESKTWMEKALQHGGDTAGEVLEHYGDLMYKLGDKPAAADYWKKAMDMGGGSDDLEQKIESGTLNE